LGKKKIRSRVDRYLKLSL